MKRLFSSFFILIIVLSFTGCSDSKTNTSSANNALAKGETSTSKDKCRWLSLTDASALLGAPLVLSKTPVSAMDETPCSYDDGKAEHVLTFRVIPGATKADLEEGKKMIPKAKDFQIGEASFGMVDKLNGGFGLIPRTSIMLYVYQKNSIVAITAQTPASEDDETSLRAKVKKITEKILTQIEKP